MIERAEENEPEVERRRPLPERSQSAIDGAREKAERSVAGSKSPGLRIGDAIAQAKLSVGPAGDAYEREADAVAARVVRAIRSETPARDEQVAREPRVQRSPLDMDGEGSGDDDGDSVDVGGRLRRVQRSPVPTTPVASSISRIQRSALVGRTGGDLDAGSTPRVRRIQRSASVGLAGGDLDDDTTRMLESSRGGGRSLSTPTRSKMESAFGADFSDIRVHSGSTSTELNDRIQAKAFTTGRDIYFRDGVPDATTESGQELLAHELTHTIQQGAASVARSSEGSVAAGPSGDMQRMIQRLVPTEAVWKDQTTKYRSKRLGWEYGRSDLFKAIDAALVTFHKAKDNWEGVKDMDLAAAAEPAVKLVNEARMTYVDTAFELQRSIAEWQDDKTQDDGTVKSIRSNEVALLLVEVVAELALIKATVQNARPAGGAAWGADDAFTDAGAHDPTNFRYIINGVTPGTDYREKIQADPSLFNENQGVISVSVIDQAKNSVWAPSGYILKLPASSVIAAAPHDLASNSQLSKPVTTMDMESDRLDTKFGTLSPADMTAQTPAGGHNEAAVKRDGLEVVGIFVVQDPTSPGTPVKAYLESGPGANGKERVTKVPAVSDAWMANYRSVAAEIGVPIVWLDQSDDATIGAFNSMNMIPLSTFDAEKHELVGGA